MKLSLVFFASLVMLSAFSQPAKKTSPKEKPPTQKEMNDMMKEMQKALDSMSPEDKKMMDSLGIKMPSTKMPMPTDQQIQSAVESQSRIVPPIDNNRIASLPKTALTAATLPAYLQKVQQQLFKTLSRSTSETGESIYQRIKSKYQTPLSIGNAAVGSWAFGKPGIALYLMSKACIEDPENEDNLNNYAAMLTMAGAEQLALPILNRLNSQFPKNSTILNNIAQAWFGLGDIARASKYIDSTLALCAWHPQANMIKARVELNKGNKQGAIAAIKHAIEKGYSNDKEKELDDLDYQLKSEDLDWDRPAIKDALGLTKFKWPAYPKDVFESKLLEPAWEEFKEACSNKIKELQAQREKLEQNHMEQQQARTTSLLQAGQTGTSATLFPELAPKAFIKLAYLVKGIEGVNNFVFAEDLQPVLAAASKITGYEETESAAMNEVEKKYKNKFGEGKENPFEARCKDENAIRQRFLIDANTTMEQRTRVYLNEASRQINNMLYYRLYTQWPDEFALSVVNAQISWLTQISTQKVSFRKESGYCQKPQATDTSVPGPLQQFDVVHCEYKSELDLIFGSINIECGRMTTKLDLGAAKIEVKTKQGDRDNETLMDQFQSCSIEAGIKRGVGYGKGPLKVEAKVGATAYLEIGKTGITDAGVKFGADIKAGTNIVKPLSGSDKITTKDADGNVHTLEFGVGPIKDYSVSIVGAEAKISMNSGFSAEGKGLLKGMKFE